MRQLYVQLIIYEQFTIIGLQHRVFSHTEHQAIKGPKMTSVKDSGKQTVKYI